MTSVKDKELFDFCMNTIANIQNWISHYLCSWRWKKKKKKTCVCKLLFDFCIRMKYFFFCVTHVVICFCILIIILISVLGCWWFLNLYGLFTCWLFTEKISWMFFFFFFFCSENLKADFIIGNILLEILCFLEFLYFGVHASDCVQNVR